MNNSILDSIIYRNLFSVTELALDLVNINIGNQDKRIRIKSAFLIISRRQKNRIMDGLSHIKQAERLKFVAGCFHENSNLLKKRIAIISEITDDIRKSSYEELDKFTEEVLDEVAKAWVENMIDGLTDEQMNEEIRKWKSWSR